MTAYTRKVNCMFGKRASLAISGIVVYIHNCVVKAEIQAVQLVRVVNVVRKDPFILKQDFRLIQG